MDRVDLIVFLGLWVRLDGLDLMVFLGWGSQGAVGDWMESIRWQAGDLDGVYLMEGD